MANMDGQRAVPEIYNALRKERTLCCEQVFSFGSGDLRVFQAGTPQKNEFPMSSLQISREGVHSKVAPMQAILRGTASAQVRERVQNMVILQIGVFLHNPFCSSPRISLA